MNFNIILSADENYIKYASVLMYSILKNIDKNKTFKDFSLLCGGGGQEALIFHLLSDFISESSKEKLKNLENSLTQIFPTQIKIHTIDNDVFKGLPKLGGNYAAYYRILFFDFVKPFIDEALPRCLYLDVDMLVNCDIREIFALSLEGKLLGAVSDFGRYGGRVLKGKSKNIKFDKSYFNSGFLLFDTKSWESLKCEEKALQIAREFELQFHDQDILNVLFLHNYKNLSFAYDFIVNAFGASVCIDENKHFNIHHTRKDFEALKQNPKIFHYCGEKPWSRGEISYVDNSGVSVTKLWWEVAERTPYFNEELQKPKSDLLPLGLGYFILQDTKYFGVLKRIIQAKTIKDSSLPFDKKCKNANYAYEVGKTALRLKHKPLIVFVVRLFRVVLRVKPKDF